MYINSKVNIEYNIIEESPFVIFNFKNKNLTENQKELIRYIYYEFYDLINYSDFDVATGELINLVLSKEYNLLYQASLHLNLPLIASYLLSNFLEECKKTTKLVKIDLMFRHDHEFESYYLSLLDKNLIKQNPNIFDIASFSRCVKYSDNFIDKNFKEFINKYGDFYNINVQLSSVKVLIKHIGEFDVNSAISELNLNKESANELELLDKIVN